MDFIRKAIIAVVMIAVVLSAGTVVTHFLWNWLMPIIFGLATVTWLQAMVILFVLVYLSVILAMVIWFLLSFLGAILRLCR